MKIISFLLLVFLTSTICCQIKTNTEMNNISSNTNGGFISYQTLKYSMDSVIISNKEKLNENEIINLRDYIDNFSENQFNELKKQSLNDVNSKEFFILEYNEGEVVTMRMHYIFFNKKNDGHFYMDRDVKIIKTNMTKTDMGKIFVTPIVNKNYKDVIIISQTLDKKTISTVGNSNDILNKVLW